MGFISTAQESFVAGLGDSQPGLRDWECEVEGWEGIARGIAAEIGATIPFVEKREEQRHISVKCLIRF